jgi:WhiB family redox-sensing transcriptional regulator
MPHRSWNSTGTPDHMAAPVFHKGRTGMAQYASPVDDLIWNLAEDLEAAAWMSGALCAQTDPEVFFPEKGGSTREAKKVCRACDVRAECLEYAFTHGEHFGIWGGLSEQGRRALKRVQVVA